MAIEKYIINKSDLTKLLRGEDLAIQPMGNIKGFCMEITDNPTNGDMIMAMFPEAIKSNFVYSDEDMKDYVTIYLDDYVEMRVSYDWWNAPYKREVKKYDSKRIARSFKRF
jgi:hypothetical protein